MPILYPPLTREHFGLTAERKPRRLWPYALVALWLTVSAAAYFNRTQSAVVNSNCNPRFSVCK